MNPFRYANIVEGVHFYDRDEELLRLTQTLEGGNNIVLYAPRRYGKTLKKIAGWLRGLVPTVSFDSSGNPAFSVARIEGFDREDSLKDVIDLPDKLASKEQKWIIAFDEFQEITTLNGESFEKLLRVCIQHHQNVSYIFLGSRTHLLKDLFNNKNRAFYNAAMLMNIDVIDREESVAYVQSKFKQDKIEIDKKTAGYVVDKVFLIPYYIQLISAELWQEVIITSKKITKETVDKAVERIISLKSDYYWELTSRQTTYRKKVLKALSEMPDEIFSKETTKRFNLGAVSSTQKALEVLIEQGIVDKINKRYIFTDPIYTNFVKQFL